MTDEITPSEQYAFERGYQRALVVMREMQRQWTDLTATEIKLLRRAANNDREFAALLIARFKEKNV